ncbi:transcription factor domain protein [Aspergillus clavatus NRRL 1]|uniref:Fungal specific transcription factor domain protein n=1 Tax=Aspergillus clavatus (strain ATCC 1007 / CBS 513.65 / DSM 816 / NCTC 3887 / NRRL 1 / QM 1276 / 107) TaxID=344612 RepID=A1CUD8_ASPCL|nr:fungal specific transcription factor domain protein [Aspergillus clavatus NRRL 1]EAW06925.1 fungal specific transcription factor domain protein [Aspergillus clavatus NRRL 1]
MEDDSMSGTGAASHACASCKKNKRRCDKHLPSCGSCLKTGRVCDYSTAALYANESDISDLQRRVQELEEHVLELQNKIPRASSGNEVLNGDYFIHHRLYPSLSTQAYYLDSEVWSSLNVSDQSNQIYAPDEITAALGSQSDIDHIRAEYFQSIHIGMPCISRIRVLRLTQSPRGALKADIALLLLCMKLVQEVPHRQDPRSLELYTTTKEFSKRLELEGLLTLRTVQASLLLLIYEIGHGMFPAAFTTIGFCARQGVALGLHSKLAPQLHGKPRTWVDWEERQRVWWTIVILDRYVALGGDYRPLCTDDPGRDTLLPADDHAWDSGEMVPPERVSLSSQTVHTLSPFARLAQAANLLGRVIRHCNDTTLEINFVLDDFETLCQAIYSLMELLPNDDPLVRMDATLARTVCFRWASIKQGLYIPYPLQSVLTDSHSALFKLSNHHSCDLFDEENKYLDTQIAPRVRECMQKCLHIIKDVCGQTTSLIQRVREVLTQDTLKQISPLMLNCIYICAQNIAWMAHETGDPQFVIGKLMCEDVLRLLDGRWRTAGKALESFFGELSLDLV